MASLLVFFNLVTDLLAHSPLVGCTFIALWTIRHVKVNESVLVATPCFLFSSKKVLHKFTDSFFYMRMDIFNLIRHVRKFTASICVYKVFFLALHLLSHLRTSYKIIRYIYIYVCILYENIQGFL
jgi:hypothetical protein